MSEQESKSDNMPYKEMQPISLPHYAVQLRNAVPIEIVAQRFPVEIDENTKVNIQIKIEGINIDSNTLQAQSILNVSIESEEPSPFTILFKIVGLFSYSPEYSTKEVRQFLRQGSVSVLLPFARELANNLCMRFQIPIVMLPIIQLTDPNNPQAND